MRKLVPFVVLALSVAVIGCKKESIAGTYTNAKGNLVLNEGGKFTLGGGSQAIEGTWTQEDKKAVLTPQTFAGKPKAEAMKQLDAAVKAMGPEAAKQLDPVKKMMDRMEMPMSEDGKTLTLSIAGESMTFTKEAAK